MNNTNHETSGRQYDITQLDGARKMRGVMGGGGRTGLKQHTGET